MSSGSMVKREMEQPAALIYHSIAPGYIEYTRPQVTEAGTGAH